MGDSRPRDSNSPYLYIQHPSHIHSGQRRPAECPPTVGPFAASLSLQRRSHAATQQHLDQQPTLLLLQHPTLQLVRLDAFHPDAALAASFPAVIVSPHSQSPTAERDRPRPAVKNHPANLTRARQQLDGNNGSLHGVQRGAPSMTSSTAATATMGPRREEPASFPRSQRPSIVSHHSNSVPSTPLQFPRQFETRSRSPSPNGGLGSHSPRSVSSEANGTMASLRKGPRHLGKCQYETNVAFGRRRIPYTSSDILEKAKEEPKKELDPHEDEKLSGDMRELYDRLLPSEESSNRRLVFVKKLENILLSEWPGNEFKVHVFGSSGNLLYTSESDVDICIQTPMTKLEEMHSLAEALAKHGMEKVVCVPQAKVRIVKIWDPELELACDMNVNNLLALENTRMIKTYVQIDDRVRELAMIIKYWTKQRILNDAALGGTISSYTWICMILNFLQTRDPPIIPALHKLPYRKNDERTSTPCDSDFADDLDKLRGFGEDNKESLGQLLFHFFRRYGHEVDYEKDVISVREGKLITRVQKRWDLASLTKEARNRLCVEEPFNTDRNLGNSADEFAWRGIHLEIRRAFDLLADGGQLEKACEQYEFPPEEKVVFKKPTPAPKPTLTASAPSGRGGRGGSGHRGGRGGFNQKGNHGYGRRASSGAAFGANRPPFLNSPPISAAPGQEYFPRGLNEHLHDQLFHQYQLLEIQSNSLRAQLAAQQRAQQAHQVQAAQIHAHAVAQAQAQAQSRGQSTNGSPQKSPYINGRSSPRPQELGVPASALPHTFLYHYPGFFEQPQGSAAVSQDGSRTNPSSPSLTNSIPGLRRTIHRSSNASDTGSIRSQSQPARAVPQQTLPPSYNAIPQYFDPSAFAAGYPIARSTQEVATPQLAPEAPYSPLSNFPEPAIPSDHGTPKEYVGYYVAEQPQPRPALQDYSVPQIPSYNEITQRRRRVSPEITQPLLNTALRRVSRSPSPLGGHVRSYSTGVTPPNGAKAQQRKDHRDSTQPPDDGSPVIVNGSFPAQPRESRNRSETVDALPSTLDVANPSALGIYVNTADQYRMTPKEQRQQFILDEIQRQKGLEMLRANIANGSGSNTSPTDTNGLSRVPSVSKQPFPTLPESWMNYDSTDGEKNNRSTDISPTRTQPPQWRTQYGNGLSPLDTLNVSRAPPQEVKSATLPLLSPVFETRTPSPTASRQSDAKLVNGNKSQSKEQHQQQRRASHTPGQASSKENSRGNPQKGNVQLSDKGNKSNGGNTNSNGSWQQQATQKRRKKQNKPKQGNEAKNVGEPLPASAADRKGG
ncbi:uncharacterized protein BDR25DRAFT_2497 [Lindgomyces ingoldianus]|uniref:Uncharacterized protein n=1 Tax=Lindgomyces ingoldianus TaxID=673940 RepID=A0ACB6REJ1_9PLEO|nr:uncharacterized protein BDR25DRAFT_2497 [Lindgomyces ingoldianus]KAF2477616.1 hypothetical protein BDR25DRAFT_2497 [Lindgomyces ingoldianus]